MLNQLIESKSGKQENTSRGGYLLTTFVLIVGLCFSAVLYSLFAKDFQTNFQELELSALVVPISDNAPPEIIEKRETAPLLNKNKSSLPSRQANILRMDESPIAPKDVSITLNTQKARPNGNFLVADKMETNGSPHANFGKPGDGVGGIDVSGDAEPNTANSKVIAPPPLPPVKKQPEDKTQKAKVPTISGGVVNGKAQFLPKPIYTAAAKALKINGEVSVQVTIDEKGNVVSANAASGHPLLRGEAEKAARNAKFDPTFLTGQPVKIIGIIVYKFSMQ